MSTDPIWLQCARLFEGEAEIPGIDDNPIIVRMWDGITGPLRHDEEPWCSAFVHHVFHELGMASTGSAAARSWLRWGVALPAPAQPVPQPLHARALEAVTGRPHEADYLRGLGVHRYVVVRCSCQKPL